MAAKAQGLLALIGTSPNLRRTRVALQDKLWSEASPEQGSGNLRQTLARLRLALGEYRDCLITELGWIGLDPAKVRVVLDPEPKDWELTGDPPEFVEGLDIPDPEFEDWVRDQRTAFAARAEAARDLARKAATTGERLGSRAALLEREVPATRERPVLVIVPSQADSAPLRQLADIVAADIASYVAQRGDAEVLMDLPRDTGLPRVRALGLMLRASGSKGYGVFQAQLFDPRRRSLIWTADKIVRFPATHTDAGQMLQLFAAETGDVVAFELGRVRPGESGSERASTLGYRALRQLASFDRKSLEEADRLFKAAYESNPAPVFLAWRAHLKLTSLIERHQPFDAAARHHVAELAAHAVEAEPYNPIVTALASDVLSWVEGNSDRALGLARSAVAAGPVNPFAREALAYRLAWTSDVRAAHVEAVRALRFAAHQPNVASWTTLCCITAFRSGRYDEAIHFAETAHRQAPDFKPPLRFLAALRYQRGDEAGAVEALHKLRRLEPDFSLELYRSEDYPVPSLRGTPLIRIAGSGLL